MAQQVPQDHVLADLNAPNRLSATPMHSGQSFQTLPDVFHGQARTSVLQGSAGLWKHAPT